MKTSLTYHVMIAAVGMLCMLTASVRVHAQDLPVRARDFHHLSDNNTNYVLLQAANGMTTDYTLRLPVDTSGAAGALLLASNATGNVITSQWLAPGGQGTILYMNGGVPQWSLSMPWFTGGNVGTNPTTNFVGTTDAQDLAFRTNNVEHLRLTSAGDLRLGPNGSATTTRSTLHFEEDGANGSESVGFQAPSALAGNSTYIFPGTIGGVGTALRILSVAGTTATLDWTPEAVQPATLFARKAADQAYTATALANDNDLVLSLLGTNTYEFEAVLAYDGAIAGAGITIGFVCPSATAMRWTIVNGAGSSVAPSSVTGSGNSIADLSVNYSSPGTDMSIHIKGVVVMGAAGTLQLQAASSTGATVNLLSLSYLKASRIVP